MPYIQNNERERAYSRPKTWQDLSYQLAAYIRDWIVSEGKTVNSGTIGEVWSAIEGAKQAFDEEVARPYERQKAKENGTIFDEIRAGL